jgi:hypothetical protein
MRAPHRAIGFAQEQVPRAVGTDASYATNAFAGASTAGCMESPKSERLRPVGLVAAQGETTTCAEP